MQKKILSYIIILIIGVGIGTIVPKKNIIEEKIVYKDRTTTVTKEVIVERPDGTKETYRDIVKKEKNNTTIDKKEKTIPKNDWVVGVKYELFRPVPVYTVDVSRRVVGDFYVTVYGRTDATIGFGLLYSF